VTSLSLLEQVRHGEHVGWQRLMLLYRPLVLWWCRRRGVPAHDAEDVAQEVFRTVAIRVAEFVKPAEGGGFRAWLKTIAHHKVIDYRRRAGRGPTASGGSAAQQALATVPAARDDSTVGEEPVSERVILLRQALQLVRREVEPRTWEAAWKVIVDGRPAADVAAELGMQPANVYTAKSRVLSRLRRELAGLIE
jgi:RNA polymerase sigma-70 factor (ECF subfamily)